MAAIPGSCRCERIRFEVTLPTRFCAHCHCTSCRRSHGAAFVTWVGVPLPQFRLVDGRESLGSYTSPEQARRSFCTTCGSMLFYESPRWPGEIHIARVQIPGPIDRLPAAHVYYDLGVDWFRPADDLKKLGGATGTEPIG
jgi:hypothetical protein